MATPKTTFAPVPDLPDSAAAYEVDFDLWIQAQVKALESKQFDHLDLDNLIEELNGLANRDKRSLYSHMQVFMMHCLKWVCQPDQRSNSWRLTLKEQLDRIRTILEDSPSLKNYDKVQLERKYAIAREKAADETGLPLDTFPIEMPLFIDTLVHSIDANTTDETVMAVLTSAQK